MESKTTSKQEAQAKKTYDAPRLSEHGAIEDITGFVQDGLNVFSGSLVQHD
jgi:hypothetical protein